MHFLTVQCTLTRYQRIWINEEHSIGYLAKRFSIENWFLFLLSTCDTTRSSLEMFKCFLSLSMTMKFFVAGVVHDHYSLSMEHLPDDSKMLKTFSRMFRMWQFVTSVTSIVGDCYYCCIQCPLEMDWVSLKGCTGKCQDNNATVTQTLLLLNTTFGSEFFNTFHVFSRCHTKCIQIWKLLRQLCSRRCNVWGFTKNIVKGFFYFFGSTYFSFS